MNKLLKLKNTLESEKGDLQESLNKYKMDVLELIKTADSKQLTEINTYVCYSKMFDTANKIEEINAKLRVCEYLEEGLKQDTTQQQEPIQLNITMCAYKGRFGWLLMHPQYLTAGDKRTKEFNTKKELEKYCKENKIKFKIIDVL